MKKINKKVNHEILKLIDIKINNEFVKATLKHKPFNSFHEGYAVILEELDELWNEIKKKKDKRDLNKIKTETIHTSAMLKRLLYDLIYEGE